MTKQQATVQFYPDKEVGGIKGWYWPTNDVQTWPFIKGDWEVGLKENLFLLMNAAGKEFRTVVQAGGNCGMYPRLLADVFKKVYTFEPDPLNFYTLNMNCAQANIFKIQAAVGETGGFVSMVYRSTKNLGMHQVKTIETSPIPMLRIDDLPFTDVDLLWLDIEGYEKHALKGAEQTIRKNNPFVVCEGPSDEMDKYMFDTHGYSRLCKIHYDGVYYNQSIL